MSEMELHLPPIDDDEVLTGGDEASEDIPAELPPNDSKVIKHPKADKVEGDKKESKKKGKKKGKKGGRRAIKHMLEPHRSVNLKIYIEQIIHNFSHISYNYTYKDENGKTVTAEFITRELLDWATNTDRDKGTTHYIEIFKLMQKDLMRWLEQVVNYPKNVKKALIYAVIHYRDTKRGKDDGIWEPSAIKPHIHIVYKNKKYPEQVRTIVKSLGIRYHATEDLTLLEGRGIETIDSLDASVVYLAHATREAIRDGKEPYDIEEIVTNVSESELMAHFARYNGKTISSGTDDAEATVLEYIEEAQTVGRELLDFTEWYLHTFLPRMPLKSKKDKALREMLFLYYENAQDKAVASHPGISRINIFIEGADAGTGKTKGSEILLKHRYGDNEVHTIDTDGSGKYDNVKSYHKALVIDDVTVPLLIKLCEDKPVRLQKRNKNNPIFMGEFVIITYNKPFLNYLEDGGYKLESDLVYNPATGRSISPLNNIELQSKTIQAMYHRFSDVKVEKDWATDDKDNIILTDLYYCIDEVTKKLKVKAKALQFYKYKINKLVERGSTKQVEYKRNQVKKIVKALNAISIRREDMCELIEITDEHPLIKERIRGNRIDTKGLNTESYQDFNHYIADNYKINQSILDKIETQIEAQIAVGEDYDGWE